VLSDQEEGGMQVTLFAKKRKGCMSINLAREGPNGRRSKDLTPNSKPKPLGAKKKAKEKIEKLGEPHGRRT